MFYGRISGSLNLTACENIPKSEIMPQKKIFSLGNCTLRVGGVVRKGKRFAKNGRENTPESILRMHVVKADLPARRGRHCAEKKHRAFRRPDRGERMCDEGGR